MKLNYCKKCGKYIPKGGRGRPNKSGYCSKCMNIITYQKNYIVKRKKNKKEIDLL